MYGLNQSLFGAQDELRAHQLEIELFSLSPSNFESLEGFFTKFKSLVIIFKQCGIDKKDDQLVLSILSKLGPDYSVFVSTFHDTRLDVPKWKMPSLNTFLDSLTKEQDKLIHMGVLNSFKGKDNSLLVQGRNNFKSKENQIVKNPKLEIEDESSKPNDEDSVKKGKKKGSTYKFSYCRKGFHSQKKCFKNNMYSMSQLLDKIIL